MINWIKTTDSVPKKQGHYLVRVECSFPKNYDILVAEFYDDKQDFYCECIENVLEDVIEWAYIDNEPEKECETTLGFYVRKKNPKDNAPQYKIETMNDLFKLTTSDNVNRLFSDLLHAFTIIAHQKEALDSTQKDTSEKIEMSHIYWIDD